MNIKHPLLCYTCRFPFGKEILEPVFVVNMAQGIDPPPKTPVVFLSCSICVRPFEAFSQRIILADPIPEIPAAKLPSEMIMLHRFTDDGSGLCNHCKKTELHPFHRGL